MRMPRETEGRASRKVAGFTMVEIALALAIIGFALVAIIGVLPAGLNVQRENREETVITQDATYFMEAIRSGARGLDELTNRIINITNYWSEWNTAFDPWVTNNNYGMDGYNRFGSRRTSTNTANNDFLLTNGVRIVGLLGQPSLVRIDNNTVRSNYVVALVRSLSGNASEKYPQSNSIVLDVGFSYRMVAQVENVPSHVFAPPPNPSDDETTAFRNANAHRSALQRNLHEVRLRFSWPLLPGNRFGNGRQTFRAMAGGELPEYRLLLNESPLNYQVYTNILPPSTRPALASVQPVFLFTPDSYTYRTP